MSETAPPEPALSTTMGSRSPVKSKPSSARSTCEPDGRSNPIFRKVHVVLAPKGGCGKTYIASLIAQALIERGEPVLAFDTDRENASFVDIKALNVSPVDLYMQGSDEIDINAMDEMTEAFLTQDKHVVIDNGATSFAPVSRYMVEGNIPAAIAEAGKRMVVHVIVAGGQELEQTARGFVSVASQFPDNADLVLWLNDHHGSVDAGSVRFEQTPVFERFQHRIKAVIRLPRLNPTTFGANLADMLARGMTFAEADASPDFFVMARQRLRQIKRPIFEQIEPIL